LRTVFGDYERSEKLFISDPQVLAKYSERGRYLVDGAAACGTCHASDRNDGDALSGGRLISDSFGDLMAANITPDKETGIGDWNVAEIMRAIRASIDKDGKPLSLDTHRAYRWMSDRDAKAISISLLAMPAVSNPVERRQLGGFERNRFGLFPQHQDFAGYVPELTPPKVTAEVSEGQTYDARWGRYLANNVAQCYSCHTTDAGSPLSGVPFAGGGTRAPLSLLSVKTVTSLFDSKITQEKPASLELVSPEGREVLGLEEPETNALEGEKSLQNVITRQDSQFPLAGPDIRGSAGNGLAAWSVDDIIRYLSSGEVRSEDGAVLRTVDSAFCPWENYSQMTIIDKRSIAAYLKAL